MPAAIPSRPRRAQYPIEAARGHHLSREHEATLGMLTRAYDTAPETIRFNMHARHMVAELPTGPPALRRQASELAQRSASPGDREWHPEILGKILSPSTATSHTN